jgi:hypothetical protein
MHPDQEKDYANKQASENQCCSTPSSQPLKDFNSCGIEEKVARLHVTIRDLRREIHYCYQSQSAMATKLYAFEHHQHSENGDCMIRIEDSNRNGSGITGGSISNGADLLS